MGACNGRQAGLGASKTASVARFRLSPGSKGGGSAVVRGEPSSVGAWAPPLFGHGKCVGRLGGNAGGVRCGVAATPARAPDYRGAPVRARAAGWIPLY